MILAQFDKILQTFTCFMAFYAHSSVQHCQLANLATQKTSLLEGLHQGYSIQLKEKIGKKDALFVTLAINLHYYHEQNLFLNGRWILSSFIKKEYLRAATYMLQIFMASCADFICKKYNNRSYSIKYNGLKQHNSLQDLPVKVNQG